MDDFESLFSGLDDGAYTVKLDFLNSTIDVPIVVEAGEVEASTVALNENYSYTGKVVDAEGETVNLTMGEASFDCFQFHTF